MNPRMGASEKTEARDSAETGERVWNGATQHGIRPSVLAKGGAGLISFLKPSGEGITDHQGHPWPSWKVSPTLLQADRVT